MLFNKLIKLNDGTEKLRIVYIEPSEIDNQNEIQNEDQIKIFQNKIFENYINFLSVDNNKYWKFQIFNENDQLELLHWSEYINLNKLFYDNIYTTMLAEGIVINQEKVIY